MNLNNYTTETRNPNTMRLDEMTSLEIIKAMNNEDKQVPVAMEAVLPQIARLVDKVAEAFENGGRLVYVGAGTSGRLGVLDASECPPTYGVSPDQVIGLIAGGDTALRNPVEGAEDSLSLGQDDLIKINLKAGDILVGIAASGRTPYVIGALKYAKELGCFTATISCNKGSEIGKISDIAIEVEVGPEVLTGSTRLKSGTAQKLILNMITTASMVRTGKAYENLMVNVVQSNEKLCVRAENIVMDASGVSREEAKKLIAETNGDVKLAITMLLSGKSKEEAEKLLHKAKGHVREAVQLSKGE